MALIHTRILDDELELCARNVTPVRVALSPDYGDELSVRVWNDTVPARACCPEADRWLSEMLKTSVRLVYMPDSAHRPTGSTADHDFSGHPLSFADGFPVLVLGRASLDDLNDRLPVALSIRRFRPNLVIEGAAPFAEDEWRAVSVGTVRLVYAKKCSRCSVTTVDPDTGLRGKEPLRTLAGYRADRDGEVYFGVNMVPESGGVIHEGDTVLVEGDPG
jgi:uncharacterized protein YcbX